MRTYHITFDRSDEKWKLRAQGGDRASMVDDTKEELVSRATKWADEAATPADPISIIIHLKNGEFEEERTYPRGADPKRSKG